MRHEITWGGGVRDFAGLWEKSHPADMPEGLESFTFVIGPACPDVAPIHDRTRLRRARLPRDLHGGARAAGRGDVARAAAARLTAVCPSETPPAAA
jgi:hypothetical protein